MIELILIETVGIGQFGLKWMAKEEEFDDILQDFSGIGIIFFLKCGLNFIISSYRTTIDKDGLNWFDKCNRFENTAKDKKLY
ncbi:hypothetical protein C2G38_2186583 [Gigaspora rosea]|uniref:Uncharacterized protein n=1 Tax=Gigaspora rosea TaxID=44941 RepID=A0A397V7U0_9GLOM|nr:hypothetical protein C2G38_2186583 [Gigaspora rosea]